LQKCIEIRKPEIVIDHYFYDMKTQMLLQQYKLFLDSYVIEAKDINYAAFNQQIRYLELIARVENSSLTVLDFFQRKYIFVRSKIIDLIDFDQQKAEEMGNLYFFTIMHPDDLPKVMDTNIRSINYIKNLPIDQRLDYKIISEYRLRNKTGQYTRFIQQIAFLELDLKGTPWLVLMLHDLSPNQTDTKSFQRKLVNIKTGKSVLFEDEESEKTNLSKREIEVLGLLNKGKMSKEIAVLLFISVNTVNNHRQKIIEKMNVESTNEAIIYAKKIGII